MHEVDATTTSPDVSKLSKRSNAQLMKLPVPTEVIYSADLSTLGLHLSDGSVIGSGEQSSHLPTQLRSIKVGFTPDEMSLQSLVFEGES